MREEGRSGFREKQMQQHKDERENVSNQHCLVFLSALFVLGNLLLLFLCYLTQDALYREGSVCGWLLYPPAASFMLPSPIQLIQSVALFSIEL